MIQASGIKRGSSVRDRHGRNGIRPLRSRSARRVSAAPAAGLRLPPRYPSPRASSCCDIQRQGHAMMRLPAWSAHACKLSLEHHLAAMLGAACPAAPPVEPAGRLAAGGGRTRENTSRRPGPEVEGALCTPHPHHQRRPLPLLAPPLLLWEAGGFYGGAGDSAELCPILTSSQPKAGKGRGALSVAGKGRRALGLRDRGVWGLWSPWGSGAAQTNQA